MDRMRDADTISVPERPSNVRIGRAAGQVAIFARDARAVPDRVLEARGPLRLAHHTTILTLLIFGAAWGACLLVAGLHAARLGLNPDRPDVVLVGLGIAGIAAGNFVFMEVVADRLLQGSRRRVRDAAEMTVACVMIVSLAAAAVVWFARTLP